jgi:hypothetical protein
MKQVTGLSFELLGATNEDVEIYNLVIQKLEPMHVNMVFATTGNLSTITNLVPIIGLHLSFGKKIQLLSNDHLTHLLTCDHIDLRTAMKIAESLDIKHCITNGKHVFD